MSNHAQEQGQFKSMDFFIQQEVNLLRKEIELMTKKVCCGNCGEMLFAITPDNKVVIRCRECGEDNVYKLK